MKKEELVELISEIFPDISWNKLPKKDLEKLAEQLNNPLKLIEKILEICPELADDIAILAGKTMAKKMASKVVNEWDFPLLSRLKRRLH